MPLSKARNRERMRLARLVQPNPPPVVQPNETKIASVQPIGIPVKPTDKQKAEWAKFKSGQR